MTYHSTYRGIPIFQSGCRGYPMRWAIATACGGIAAHTLAALRRIISERSL